MSISAITPLRNALSVIGGVACLGFGLGCLGPTIDAMDEARDVQASIDDAEQAARQQARREAAIEASCGPNAVVVLHSNGSWRCANKHGLKSQLTARVQL